MEAYGSLTGGFHLGHHCQHLFQSHLGTVEDAAARLGKGKQRRVYKAAGVDDAVGGLQQRRTPLGDQVRCSGSCAYKMYHCSHSFTSMVEK